MDKGSGIRYFCNQAELLDSAKVLYSFSSGSQYIQSEADSFYSGFVNGDTGLFWSKPGSGLFSGSFIEIPGSGLYSRSFCGLLSFELFNTGKQLLLSNLDGFSGFEIGLNDAHKIYFRSKSDLIDNYFTSNLSISSKNLISFSFANNFLEIGHFNFSSKSFDLESAIQNFGQVSSNTPMLIGSGYTGYIDNFLFFNAYANGLSLNQVASGWIFSLTGFDFQTETTCLQEITGYVTVPFVETGIIQYSGDFSGGNGIGDFESVFPNSSSKSFVTGILLSGQFESGVTGLVCSTVTGGATPLFQLQSGYVKSFGMDKVFVKEQIDGDDLIKIVFNDDIFSNFYNKKTDSLGGSGFYSESLINSGSKIYLNGVYQDSGIIFSQNVVKSSLFASEDSVLHDSVYGGPLFYSSASGQFSTIFSGQEFFLNGQNLVSGINFVCSGDSTILTGDFTGISGTISEFFLAPFSKVGTGSYWPFTGLNKNGSVVFINGIRQVIDSQYKEGSFYDLLTFNEFDGYNNFIVYDKNGDFWE